MFGKDFLLRAVIPMSFTFLLLAACGGADDPPAAPVPSPTAPTASQEAWEVEWQTVVAEANQEGRLSIFGPPGAQYRAFVDHFSRAFPGINVELHSLAVADRTSRIQAERAAGQYTGDVWLSGTTPIVTTLKQDGVTVPLEPHLILPEVLDSSAWLGNELGWADLESPPHTLIFQGGVAHVIAYNTNLVDPAEFESFWDLLDPKWKGNVVSRDIRNPGPGGVPSRFIYTHPDLGADWFTRFYSEMDVTMSDDMRQMIDWVAQEVYHIGVFLSSRDVNDAAVQGLPVAMVTQPMREGGILGLGQGSITIIDRAPNPNAATVFVNWLLSREGQIAWQSEVLEPSLRQDIPKDMLNPEDIPDPNLHYVNAGGEEYSWITGADIRPIIDDGLAQAGR